MEYIQIKKEILSLIENNETKEAKLKLEKVFNYNRSDMELHTMKSILEYMDNEYDKADKTLVEIYDKYEFNFDINYNLAIINYYLNNYENAIRYSIRAIFLDRKKQDSLLPIIGEASYALNDVEKLKNIKQEQLNVFMNVNKDFPQNGEKTYIGEAFKIDNNLYYTGMYDYYFEERDNFKIVDSDNKVNHLVKSETLKGKTYTKFHYIFKERGSISIMPLVGEQRICIRVNNEEPIELKNLLKYRFYYYSFEKHQTISIYSNEEFVIGDPIELRKDKNKPKLILNIFVDGLSQKYLDEKKLEKIMPNTYKFFKEGTICSNAYASGEWTYVSMASMFTGKFTTNHRVYHPGYSTDNLKRIELYSERFEEEGYFCAKIDGDWRSTVSSGYAKGMDRVIYQPSIRGMHGDEVIMETIDHLEAFKERNNFVWICIPDLHDIADEYEGRISTQINASFNDRIINKTNESSVRKAYNEIKVNRYGNQLKRIDVLLSILFNYLEENYDKDEYIVSLVSDHGQGYLVDTQEFLDEGRSKIAMMFKGRNIPIGKCGEFIQGLDIFPIIFNSLGNIKFKLNDGNVPIWFGGNKEREFTITESIFPGSSYKIVINDKKFKFFFETNEKCTEDGRVKLDKYSIKLIDRASGNEVSKYNIKIVDNYVKYVFEHISNYRIYE